MMNTNLLALANGLSDHDLLARIAALAGKERETCVELVAHLAELESRLRRLQALLRREIPDGDPGVIFDRAIALLLEKVEKEKLGAGTKPRAIRPGTDKPSKGRTSRHTPSDIKRSTWRHDGAQCAFVSKDGRRCTERAFLEFHHIRPYALGGPTSAENISLRCRRHNQYEAELVFGPRRRRIEGDS